MGNVRLAEGFKVAEEDGIIGKHVFGNLYKIDKIVINNLDLLKKIVIDSVSVSKMTLVDIKALSFGGEKGGITVIAILKESHIALHTWNEYDYATVDVYTNGSEADPEKAFKYILSNLRPKKHQMFTVDRSQINLE
ncbi:MAG: adenosylmethionine decarboxylase [Candidatus Micrarchaeia archaeon]